MNDIDRASVARAYARWAPVYDLIFGSVFEAGRRASIAAVGDLRAYTQYETASAIRDAANNPGGAAGAGVGLGAGVAMGAQMMNNMMGGPQGPQFTPPHMQPQQPPPPAQARLLPLVRERLEEAPKGARHRTGHP